MSSGSSSIRSSSAAASGSSPDGADRVPLKLVDSRTFSTGVLYLTYEPTLA